MRGTPHTGAVRSARQRPRWIAPAAAALLAAGVTGWVGGCEDRAAPGTGKQTAPSVSAVDRTWRTGDAQGRDVLAVRLRLDRSEMTVADRLGMTLALGNARDERIVFDVPTETVGGFTVVEHAASEPWVDASGLRWTEHRYLLEPFLAGDKEIPSFRVALSGPRGAGGEPPSVTTAPLRVSVRSALPSPDQAALGPARGPVGLPPTPVRNARAWWIAGVAVAALVGGAAVAFSLRRRPAPLDPVARVRADLARLRSGAAQAHDGESVRRLGAELSDAVRRYVQDHLRIPASDRTTPELLADPRPAARFGAEQAGALQHLLRSLDRIRFAAAPEPGAELAPLILAAERFVEATRGPVGADASRTPPAPPSAPADSPPGPLGATPRLEAAP